MPTTIRNEEEHEGCCLRGDWSGAQHQPAVPQPKLPYLIHVYSTIGDDGISISLSSLLATNEKGGVVFGDGGVAIVTGYEVKSTPQDVERKTVRQRFTSASAAQSYFAHLVRQDLVG